MKVLAFPRDPNPYQELLYSELRKSGIKVKYLGCLTPFPNLNLLLFPLELAIRRVTGSKIVHLHWVWGFQFPAMSRFPAARRLVAYAWFRLFLASVRLFGMKLAWTAHNILPHGQVFPDDSAARRLLVRHCDVVFGHSEWSLTGLIELGAKPAKWALVRHPAFSLSASQAPLPDSFDWPTEFLFFGKIFDYKGVDDLLEAFAGLPQSVPARLTVAGECTDPRLSARLEELAARSGERVSLRMGHATEDEVAGLMGAAHVVVLPFRRVTTSGSAMLALGCGKPLIIRELPALAGLPSDAVFLYDGSIPELAKTLQAASSADRETLSRMSRAAIAYAAEATWAQLAEATAAEFFKLAARRAS
jgi:beta-1,4-mannosyltransferase